MLKLDGVAKYFGTTQVLGPVTLAVPAGGIVSLIGPSGCGKTTLLRVILGLLWPDYGTVRVAGVALSESFLPSIRQRVGYVTQDGGLFPHLTAEENITLMARHLKWPVDKQVRRLRELCSVTQLPVDALDRYPAEMSGGQRQRVSLMRALMLDPELLLLDEPLAALDPMIRDELQTDLRRIFRELHKTVVVVTHDLGEAAYLADEIVLMRSGTIVQQGSAKDLVERPESLFVTAFINAQRRGFDAMQSPPDPKPETKA